MSGVSTVNDLLIKKLKTSGVTDDVIKYISGLPTLRVLNTDLLALVLNYCIERHIFDNPYNFPGYPGNPIPLKNDPVISVAYGQFQTLDKSYTITKFDGFCKDFFRYICVCYNHVASLSSVQGSVIAESVV